MGTIGNKQEEGCRNGPPGYIDWRIHRLGESIPGLLKSLKILALHSVGFLSRNALSALKSSFLRKNIDGRRKRYRYLMRIKRRGLGSGRRTHYMNIYTDQKGQIIPPPPPGGAVMVNRLMPVIKCGINKVRCLMGGHSMRPRGIAPAI